MNRQERRNIIEQRTFGMIDENGEFQEIDLGEIRNEEKESERDCYAD